VTVKTHFYPWGFPDDAEIGPCGIWLGLTSNLSGEWARVDCARCQKQKAKLTKAHAEEEAAIVAQMGDMADFMRKQGEGV